MSLRTIATGGPGSAADSGALLPSWRQSLAGLEGRLSQIGREELRATLAPLARQLLAQSACDDLPALAEAALALCRRLYENSRSADALPLAQAALDAARRGSDASLRLRAASACGLLLTDLGDVVEAIDHHVEALRVAAAAAGAVEASRCWSNIGLAFAMGGSHELSVQCYLRALAQVEGVSGPLHGRFAACTNLANSYYHLGDAREGLIYARLALEELSRPAWEKDAYHALLLHRSLVRLLVENGAVGEAEPHVRQAVAMAEEIATPRALIAAAIIRSTYEIAVGQRDIALTRLDQALTRARGVAPVLRDTLACVVRAEEQAGNPERALLRLRELSDHVYRVAVDRAREHLELARLLDSPVAGHDAGREQALARLTAQISPPSEPAGWQTLRRLAIAASLRFHGSGDHGARVGAMTKALALAHGVPPLEALEMGLAAELHDIGLASVPEGILRKRAPFNAVEQALYLKHTDAGAEILRDDHHPRMLMAQEIARYHHARWDGAGYPERVGSRFIPLPARLCAVAEAYDAFVCGEGRRAGRSMAEALVELDGGAGTRFDPELVRQFVSMIRSEASERGLDAASPAGSRTFRELVASLEEDRGFL